MSGTNESMHYALSAMLTILMGIILTLLGIYGFCWVFGWDYWSTMVRLCVVIGSCTALVLAYASFINVLD